MSKVIGLTFAAEEQKDEEVFYCPNCGKEYKSAAALKAHAKKEHPDAFDNKE